MAKIIQYFIVVNVKQLRDPHKTIVLYLSSQNRELLWEYTTIEEKENSYNISVVNILCELTFDAVTDTITSFVNIGLTNIGGGGLLQRKTETLHQALKKLTKIVC